MIDNGCYPFLKLTIRNHSTVLARVNATYLPKYVGQTVRVTAKVLSFDGESAVLEASDGGQVSLAKQAERSQ